MPRTGSADDHKQERGSGNFIVPKRNSVDIEHGNVRPQLLLSNPARPLLLASASCDRCVLLRCLVLFPPHFLSITNK